MKYQRRGSFFLVRASNDNSFFPFLKRIFNVVTDITEHNQQQQQNSNSGKNLHNVFMLKENC